MGAQNAVIEMPTGGIVTNAGRMSVAEVVQHAKTVQEVMHAVMREGEHFGKIPGTDKPTLLKAGAEKLCMTFRIADEYRVEDLSTADAVRYRVTCIGKHQLTGIELGSGMGEGSTSEEKYRWRKAVCDEEFESTPAAMRRVKYARGKGGSFYTTKQVRTEPSDLANTVLKMACKRAKMAMVLNVTAASDCFTQDLEDLDETLREHLADGGEQAPAEPSAPPTWPADAFAKQFARWSKAVAEGLKTVDDIVAMAKTKGALTPDQEAQIRTIKPGPSEKSAADPALEAAAARAADVARDPFVAAMESAEAASAKQGVAP